MKLRLALLLSVLLAPRALVGAADFPGVKTVLSAAEWQRAGLDRLTPDQLGVLDAALIRYLAGRDAQLARAAASTVPAAPSPIDQLSDPNAPKRGLWDRFGLPNMFGDVDWRKMPPLRARVTEWAGGNRFRLDNGQVWEGSEPITYELPGREIEIQARPFGQFALIVNGQDTKLRVIRLK
jgi:hypothetical protein